MKKQWKSRIISGVLTAALTITMLPAAAFGASDKETGAAKEAAAEATGNILPDGKKTDSLTEDSVWPKVDLSDNLAEDPGEDVLLEEELADKKERAAQAAAISERSGPNVTVPLPPAAETVSKPAGEGTEDAPYLITDPKELRWFAALVNGVLEGVEQNTAACARLENDISFAEDMEADISWTPISCRLEEPYTGIFDGASHVIDSLYVVTEDVEYVSLFGVNDGMIKDLTVTGAVIRCAPKWKYRGCAGVIAGRNDENGEIKNCRIESANVEGFAYVGTVAGHSYGQIHDVAVESSEVTGTRYVGGIVGEDYDGRLTGCRMGKEPSEEDQQSGTNAEAENRAAVSGVSSVTS